MTREETVKELLTELIDMIDNGSQRDLDRADEISKTIIEALSQEPTKKPMTVDEMEREYEKSKALFHEIVECDDAISRDAVNNLQKYRYNCGDTSITGVSLKSINELPSVTPKPETVTEFADRCRECGARYGKLLKQKSGKWIKVKSGDKDFPESIVCSRCGNENSHFEFNENAEPIGKVFITSKYCPSCGRRMTGGLSKNSQKKLCLKQDLNKERQTGEWIPVSDRLPEDEQEILFSTKTGRVHSGKYHDDDSANQWYSYKDKCRAWNNVVSAWMPLPKPYEPQESEDVYVNFAD